MHEFAAPLPALADNLALADNAPWVLAACVVSCALYARGWRAIRARGRASRERFGGWRCVAFFAAWLVMLAALASPLDREAERALAAHMVQHLLLTMIVPPLFWLASPAMPCLFGLPRALRLEVVGPIIAAPAVRTLLRIATNPIVGWIAMALVTLGWHVPAIYQLALREPAWHRVEHASMLAAGLLFWLPVVEPFPYRRRWPRLAMVPYLVAADFSNTIVAAYLAFSGAIAYRWYADIGAARGIDALQDQQLAAGIMWVPGSIIYLLPAMAITAMHFVAKGSFGVRAPQQPRELSLPVLQRASARETPRDLLRIPVIGALLRQPRVRLGLRLAMLALAALIAIDGIVGPQDAPMNLAGTLPWTHWRGFAVVAILAVANAACMACPLIAPRSVLRRWITPTRTWPAALRSKWIAGALIVAWLVAYEAFDLWSSPWATAFILIGFIVAATAVDLLFEGASFCRFVCPIGQYQMLLSTVAPREVRALDADVCARCETHDCLKGRPSTVANTPTLPGCGLGLFVPKKDGNLDCTFCLDCVSACPHENIGIVSVVPGASLARAAWSSGIGTLANRFDIGVLATIFTTGAIANAAGMSAPIVQILDEIATARAISPALLQGSFVVVAMLGGALLLATAAVAVQDAPFIQRFNRIALASIPLGASVWLVHFGFHFITGWPTGEAAIRRVLHDLALSSDATDRILSCCVVPPNWLVPAEFLALSLGLAAALGVLWWSIDAMLRRSDGARTSSSKTTSTTTPARVTMAWIAPAIALIALWSVIAWVVLQPMEMRGTSGFGS